jgi:hypothetical protein
MVTKNTGIDRLSKCFFLISVFIQGVILASFVQAEMTDEILGSMSYIGLSYELVNDPSSSPTKMPGLIAKGPRLTGSFSMDYSLVQDRILLESEISFESLSYVEVADH